MWSLWPRFIWPKFYLSPSAQCLGLAGCLWEPTTTQEQMLVTTTKKEFRLNEMSDCSGIKPWEKAAKKKGMGYMNSRPKGNVISMLTHLNRIWFCFQIKYSSEMQAYLKRAPRLLCFSRNYQLFFFYMTRCNSYKMPFLLMSAKYYQALQD